MIRAAQSALKLALVTEVFLDADFPNPGSNSDGKIVIYAVDHFLFDFDKLKRVTPKAAEWI